MSKIPTQIKGVRTRKISEDSFYLVTCNNRLRQYMNQHYEPIEHIHNAWRLPDTGEKFSHLELAKYDSCFLIGKGPSLDYLNTLEYINDTPALAINEAVVPTDALWKHDLIYGIQMDRDLQQIYEPDRATMIVSKKVQSYYNKGIIIFSPYSLGHTYQDLTVECALEILKHCQIKHVYMVGFDAVVDDDTRYAECLGITDQRDPDRFIRFRDRIKKKFVNFDKVYVFQYLENEWLTHTLK